MGNGKIVSCEIAEKSLLQPPAHGHQTEKERLISSISDTAHQTVNDGQLYRLMNRLWMLCITYKAVQPAYESGEWKLAPTEKEYATEISCNIP